jgi:hypothetical protein
VRLKHALITGGSPTRKVHYACIVKCTGIESAMRNASEQAARLKIVDGLGPSVDPIVALDKDNSARLKPPSLSISLSTSIVRARWLKTSAADCAAIYFSTIKSAQMPLYLLGFFCNYHPLQCS